MKKFLLVLLSITMCLCCATSIAAECNMDVESQDVSIVYSPEFPDAYILHEEFCSTMRTHSLTTVTATVFVEEMYEIGNNGKLITTSSRLLSEKEVLSIGLDNFGDMDNARHDAVENLW